MADAPAPSGGGGWGALEVVIGIVLIIGAISTLTGTPIGSSLKGNSTTATSKSLLNPKEYTFNGCTVILTSPKGKDTISNSVTVSGSMNGTLSSCVDTSQNGTSLYAQVVDSTGATLSALTPVSMSKSIFGEATFYASVPLSGIARSTSAQVIITGPVTVNGAGIVIRIPVTLSTQITGTPINPSYPPSYTNANPVYTGPNASQSQPFVSPNSSNSTFFYNQQAQPQQNQQQYNAPQQYNPPVQNTQPATTTQNSGGGGTTF